MIKIFIENHYALRVRVLKIFDTQKFPKFLIDYFSINGESGEK